MKCSWDADGDKYGEITSNPREPHTSIRLGEGDRAETNVAEGTGAALTTGDTGSRRSQGAGVSVCWPLPSTAFDTKRETWFHGGRSAG